MPMDRSPYYSSSSSSSSDNSPVSSSNSNFLPPTLPFKGAGGGSTVVLSIECLKGTWRSDQWTGDMLQTGDIVEEIKIGNMIIKSPFKNGKSGVQKILHASYKQKDTSIHVRVRRGDDEFAELQACIVPGEQLLGRKQYILRAIDDPNYAVGFLDRTETECLNLQASRNIRMLGELERTPLQDGYVRYPWERRMDEMLAIPNSSSFYSILFLPKASDKEGTRYNDLEDTLARAHAWINAAQESGAPVLLMNIQTESLLTKISGDTASSTVNAGSLSDLSNIANTSLYGFEDYHGVDIGVVRAVRMWFSPLAGEIPIEIKIKETDTKLGFAISRTEEGFIYISSVLHGEGDAPSLRSGLTHLHHQATEASKLLVVSRISNQKVLPWMVSTTGAIRCFDTVSLSQKLSLHRHAKVPIILHVFIWERSVNFARGGGARARPQPQPQPRPAAAVPEETPPVPEETPPAKHEERREVHLEESSGTNGGEILLERDKAGEFSFRFHEFELKDNWV